MGKRKEKELSNCLQAKTKRKLPKSDFLLLVKGEPEIRRQAEECGSPSLSRGGKEANLAFTLSKKKRRKGLCPRP